MVAVHSYHLLAVRGGMPNSYTLKIFLILLLFGYSIALFSLEQNVEKVPEDFSDSGFKYRITSAINEVFSPELTIVIISMLPVIELRGAIPIGINYFGMKPLPVFILSVVGNMIPIFFVLLFFDLVTIVFSKNRFLKALLDKLFDRARKKGESIKEYEELGLIFFVAVPLPITGGWTGSLIAYLLGFRFWRSILCIFLGVLLAGVVVTLLSILGWWGAIIALTVLSLLILRRVLKIKRSSVKE